jgi:6-phosphogluconolactonase (cycloisomerase 2 family)
MMRRTTIARLGVLVIISATLGAVPVAAATAGGIRQLALPAGCLEAVDVSGCANAGGMTGPYALVVSPNGRRVYVASYSSSSIVVLNRNTTTGALSLRTDGTGCVGAGAGCTPSSLNGPNALAIAPSGTYLYVASLDSDRITTYHVSDTGALTELYCYTSAPSPGCAQLSATIDVRSMAISPDGYTLYAAASTSDALAILDIAPNGSLSQAGGGAGCVDNDGAAGTACVDGRGLEGVGAVAVPTNGLVVTGSSGGNAVASFIRNGSGDLTPAGCVAASDAHCDANSGLQSIQALTATGSRIYAASLSNDRLYTLTVGAGAALSVTGCVANGGASGCKTARALDEPGGVTLSPDRKRLYVTSGASDSLTVFDALGGELTPRPGTANCVVQGATPPAGCAAGAGLDYAFAVAMAPDGRTVYTTSLFSQAVGVFDRDEAAPTCRNLAAKVSKNDRAALRLRCNDSDGDAVAYRIVRRPAHGSTSNLNTATGRLTYTPDRGFYGRDSFRYAGTARGVSSSAATVTLRVVACPGFEDRSGVHVLGTRGRDTLIGSSGRDVICGLGEGDRLEGRGGGDLLLGGDGGDELLGQDGDDVLNGQAGLDSCLGGPGRNTFQSCEGR